MVRNILVMSISFLVFWFFMRMLVLVMVMGVIMGMPMTVSMTVTMPMSVSLRFTLFNLNFFLHEIWLHTFWFSYFILFIRLSLRQQTLFQVIIWFYYDIWIFLSILKILWLRFSNFYRRCVSIHTLFVFIIDFLCMVVFVWMER